MRDALPPFKLFVLPITPFEQNCTIILCTRTNKAAVVDPGGDLPQIEQALKESGGTIEKILLTHGHIDHAGGAAELAETLGVKVEGPHKDDQPLLDRLPQTGRQYGFDGARVITPDRYLNDGDVVTVGDVTFDILHCPGHSPGSVVFLWRRKPEDTEVKGGFAIMGDVLFRGSIGRTDLPFGNHNQLITAIKTKLMALPDDVAFICGHGPMSTIGAERRTNPFIND